MKQVQATLLEDAHRNIDAAETLFEEDFYDIAASHAYYAMFYTACAFLEGEGKQFSKHSAVIAAFGRDFANAGRVPPEFHRYLLEAVEIRNRADYMPGNAVDAESARYHIDRAIEFLEMAETLISKQP